MKKFLLTICLFCFISTTIASTNYNFDSDHTYVTFQVSHFGFSDVSGKFMAYGNLELNPTAPQNSKVAITIDTTRANTGIGELDDILTGKNFFNASQFSTATFVSNKIILTGKNAAKIYGTLTLRGIAKPIVLEVKLNKSGIHPYSKKQALGFSGTASLKRSDFDMKGYLPGVGDEVKLTIQAEAEVQKTKK